jgi:hypothetical protein
MNPSRAPWYAGILLALLQLAKTRYPQYADLIDALIVGIGGYLGLNLLEQARVANEQREVANAQRCEANRQLDKVAATLPKAVPASSAQTSTGSTGRFTKADGPER